MASFFNSFFSRWGSGLNEKKGKQSGMPSSALIGDTQNIGPDGAMQISAVWACLERRSTTVASLPLFVYEQKQGEKVLARNSRLYALLHDSPNSRMTSLEFWRAMVMNHDLRGNGYARIDRDASGEAVALWPMPADQVEPEVLSDGSMVYKYLIGDNLAVLSADNVLHIKGPGNGTIGLSRLEYMRATTDEMSKAQTSASKIFGNSGKPTGVLMIDKTLTDPQRLSLQTRFAEMQQGSTSRLYVLEANMKYQQLSISPQEQQLLETRNYGIEEVCRWFDVPPILVHHSNVTAWGSGIEQIVDGFHKLTIRPLLVSIEQAIRKRVMTAKQRASMVAEFNQDALLRGSLKDRMEIYSKATQNGVFTRNECRQYENLPPDPDGNKLTAQSNLVPLSALGKVQPQGKDNASSQDPVAQ